MDVSLCHLTGICGLACLIQSIKKLLASRPRDLRLFTLGINNGIRAGDLPELKISHVKYAKPGQAIQIRESMTVNRKIKEWCKTINLEGNYGAHSLRKTFGYIQRTKFGVGFELICKRFNHSSPSVTMRYLSTEDKEVLEILTHEI